MTPDKGTSSGYPCLAQKDGLRRVHEPRDERGTAKSPLRRTWSRLVVARRR